MHVSVSEKHLNLFEFKIKLQQKQNQWIEFAQTQLVFSIFFYIFRINKSKKSTSLNLYTNYIFMATILINIAILSL